MPNGVYSQTTVYRANWGGYTVYNYGGGRYNRIPSASSYIYVSHTYLPPPSERISGVPIAVAAWIGLSQEIDGSPYLVQGGYASIYNESEDIFIFFAWAEVYPQPPIPLGLVIPGREISVHVYEKTRTSTYSIYVIKVILTNGQTTYVEYNVSINNSPYNTYFAHFILESPSIQGELAQLPKFEDEHFWEMGAYPYPLSTYIDNGWYRKWIIRQGDYVNIGVEYIPATLTTDEEIHIWWITSER